MAKTRRAPSRGTIGTLHRIIGVCAALVLLTLGVASPAHAATPSLQGTNASVQPGDFDPRLTRAPYLTDLVELHVTVNFATDQSGQSASVSFGPASGATCSLTDSVAAERRGLRVGASNQYQWKATINLPTAGTYCYRTYLDGADLLTTVASPRFTTQQQPGDSTPFTFDVMGDWGAVDSSGHNPEQADLMQQIADSDARFMVTVGDNGYPNGNQVNYGDLHQAGADTSAIFGPEFWTVPGLTTPIFTAPGNHGTSGTAHTDITTWTQDVAVSSSGGRYQDDTYCCVNNSRSTHYGSEWYAFTAGNARFYVLDASWGDTNPGDATPYANDAAAHWAPGAPEREWLESDLASHPTQLKFAFFHYPLYADNPHQSSDTYLNGPDNLEGLLAESGVQMVFNGHAHLYQRNQPSGPGMPISYVTGGGGGTLEPVGPCSAIDAYGVGWSPTKLRGTACGAATKPTSSAQVYHFLKVTVAGSQVTVAPTNSLGQTFDVQTYQFTLPLETWIDSGPTGGTTSTTATFAFHASQDGASFACTLDGGAPQPCQSPVTYTGLAQGSHTFTVAAGTPGHVDPTPAHRTWDVDTMAPSVPTGVTAAASSSPLVTAGWTASTDNTGVTGYRIFRDGDLLATVASTSTSFTDETAQPATTYSYTIQSVDAAGNQSPQSQAASATTPPPATPVFADGFEAGSLWAWDSSRGLTVQDTIVRSGTHAARGNTTNGATYAKRAFSSSYPDAYARTFFNLTSQASQVNLLRLRDAEGSSLAYLYVNTQGRLGVHDDATGVSTTSGLAVTPGWHSVQLHLGIDGSGDDELQVWYDGTLVDSLSRSSVDVGDSPIGAMQIGETQTGRTYDVTFDDAAFADGWMSGSAASAPPVVPSFTDGFESGDLSAWDTTNGLAVQSDVVHAGHRAARGNTTNGATYAKKMFSSTYAEAYAQVFFTVTSQASQINLMRLRDASGSSLAYVYVNSQGRLGVHNDATGVSTTSDLTITPGWHSVQLHLGVDSTSATSGTLQVWCDGTILGRLSGSDVQIGTQPVGGMQIGETQRSRTYDVTFDDAAFATRRLGAQ